jgi:hypothetical protein
VKRIVQTELLDRLLPADPRAIRSRRDLQRINWWMRHPAVMAHALRSHLPQSPKQITELGAGDGSFLLHVVRKFKNISARNRDRALPATATLLDLQDSVSPETLAAFARFGWRAEPVVADVFDWETADHGRQILVANLFLHHFADERLAELLRLISTRAKLFIALEPRRAVGPLLFSHLLWAIGCNAVTRHDAPVSVRAGFAGHEISTLWPDKNKWQFTERPVGAFSHLFIAQKIV